jgi:hypothetical protein
MSNSILIPTFNGPVMVGADEGIIPDRLRCIRYDEATANMPCCKFLGLNDHHYWYCGSPNRSIEDNTGMPTKDGYPWKGVWGRLWNPEPDIMCPYAKKVDEHATV